MVIFEYSRSPWLGWYDPVTKTIHINVSGINRYAKKTGACVIDVYFRVLYHEQHHVVQHDKLGLVYCKTHTKAELAKRDMMEDAAHWHSLREFVRIHKRRPDDPVWLEYMKGGSR